MPAPQYVHRSYAGGAIAAQLTEEMSSGATAFVIAPTTGWTEVDGGSPLGTQGPFTIAVDLYTPSVEKILCSSIDLTTGIVSVYVDPADGWSGRGYDGTAAQSHVPNGSTAGVQPTWSATEADEANQAVYDLLGAGGSSSGIPIGGMIPYASKFNIPTNFMQCDGSFLEISDYVALFTALCPTGLVDTVSGNATITNLSVDANFFAVNQQVTLANSSGHLVYTINTINSISSITLNIGTGISTGTQGGVTFYPWGTGDGLTNFKLPDIQGRFMVGQSGVNTTQQPDIAVAQPISLQTGATSAMQYIGVEYIIRVQ
jgi:hypothetical protein